MAELKQSWMPTGGVLDLSKDHVERGPNEPVFLSIDVDAFRVSLMIP